MTALEMQVAFEIETNTIDSITKPISSDVAYWLNRAVESFVKTRWSGNNYKKEGFEQTQKRIDDLRTLVTDITLSTISSTNKPNSYIATLPSNYLFSLGEEVTISYTKNSTTVTSREAITNTTVDRYADDIFNPFSEHVLHNNWARPLRLYRGSYVELISDGTYTIPTYYLRYLSKPITIVLGTTTVDCNLPEQCHNEVVKIAARMYLENTTNPRYNTINNEITTME